MFPITIISGGQTGTDRAALDIALECGIDCGGWCPKGRWAEDGPIPEIYPVTEASSDDPKVRTSMNVEESDGTLIIHFGVLDDGTVFTIQKCIETGKPILEVDVSERYNLDKVLDWFTRKKIRRVNIAGPRESSAPGMYAEARRFLSVLFETSGGTLFNHPRS